jgi:CHAT domain-containing protein
MKKRLYSFLNSMVLLLVLYLIINIIYLVWHIANPDGFWGFNYFLELLRVAVLIIIIAIVALFVVGLLLTSLLSIYKNRFNFKEFLKLLGVLIIVILVPAINYFFYNSISFYLTKNLSEKYSYIEKTNEYIAKGEYTIAFKYSKQAYDKEIIDTEVSYFFFLTKLYSLTDFAQKQKLMAQYAVTINYAYCLKNNFSVIKKAEKIFIDAISISNNGLLAKERNNLLLFPTLSLAEINLTKGNYLIAENYFSRLYELNKNAQSEDVRYLITTNILFVDKALRTGDIKKAMELNIENLKLYEQSELSKTSTYFLSLLILGSYSELYLENFKAAGELLITAQPIAEKKSKKEIYLRYLAIKGNYCYQVSLNNQGIEEVIKKSWWSNLTDLFSKETSLKEELILEAEKCFKELVEETKSRSGVNNINYVVNLEQLGLFYLKTGNSDYAQDIFKRALIIMKPFKGNYKDFYNRLLINSIALVDTNTPINEGVFNEVENQLFNKITENYLFLTEHEKEQYISNIEKELTTVNSIYVKQNTPSSTGRLYNNILATKNIALFSNQNLRSFISSYESPVRAEYFKILRKKESLAFLEKNANYQGLKRDIDLQERKIANQIFKDSSFKPYNPRQLKWIDIKKGLKINEIAVEIITIPTYNLQNLDLQYYVIIVKADSRYSELIPLFKESSLTAILNKKGDTKKRINSIYLDDKLNLYNTIWKPLEHHIPSTSIVYLSVNGLLHKISFSALLIDKQKEIHILGSTKQLVNRNSASQKKYNVALFGGIDYHSIKKTSENRSFSSLENKIKNTFKTGKFSNLEYTEREVNDIKKLTDKYPTQKTILFEKKQATEQAFRNLDKNAYDIIHVATHGFYYNEGSLNTTSLLAVDSEISISESSMYRSGILLAGVNDLTKGKDNDGILTAIEISKMNMENVDLVVLSACETGLGEIVGSEGVFGLQRAFRLAGVKSMIVSLWQVPDEPTSMLMKKFYTFYLNGIPKNQALKKAQLEVRKKYPDPFNWAGFELIE